VPAISNKRFIRPTMLRDPSRMFLPVGESAPTERALLVDQAREKAHRRGVRGNDAGGSPFDRRVVGSVIRIGITGHCPLGRLARPNQGE
jgi:hypothetical protein